MLQSDSRRRVVGLDLSVTSTGICVLVEGDDRKWTVEATHRVGYPLKRDSSVQEKIERLVMIARKVVQTCNELPGGPMSVGIEGYAFSARGAQNDLAELQGVVKSQLQLSSSVKIVVVPPTQARRHVLGAGNPKGKKGIARILRVMGLEFKTDDEADAYVIAKFVAMNLEPRQPELLLG